MILQFLLASSIVQVLLYLISDKLGYAVGRFIILIATLGIYLFIAPPYFYPEPTDNGCGMPIMAISMAFWIIGGGMAIVTHLLYAIFHHLFARFWLVP